MDYSQLQLCTRPSQIDLLQLQVLFELAAFWARERQLEELAIAIANSDPVVSAWDGEKMIGFARAISDDVYRATIWDVVIHPDYLGIGLGQKLVETVLNHPRMNRVERIYLMTTDQQHVYKQVGFQRNPSTTMVLSNRAFANSSPSITADVS
ncbi:MAG: GNAT family N-acetyltransferase [Leptolyngbyaceae cyanobacterium MO_188.B28]|nr:GNAT family N-acetyltransferase [Leptolyngbyaceae cyanobacterium MO_188.B28]